MNPETSQDAANNPTPATTSVPRANLAPQPGYTATAPSRTSGGLKAVLRVAVPLLALVGVVFGITFFAQYTPKVEDDKGNGGGTKTSGAPVEPPLRFFTSTRQWNPPQLSAPGYRHLPLLAPSAILPPDADPGQAYEFSLQDRVFQAFYEPGEEQRATQFWFENRNPHSVTMQLKGVSCMACSGARVVAIPPETTKNLFQHAALAALPTGVFRGFGVGMVEPVAALSQLQWAHAQFKDDPHATFHVPAATNPDKWSPQWGILELTFRVSENPKLPLSADFATQVDGTAQAGHHLFALMYTPASPCELSRSVIDAGTIDPLSGDREYELLVYSNTRGPGSEFGDLAPPSFFVQAPEGIIDPVKFVEVTNVRRVPDTDLVDLTEQLSREHKKQTKVRAAYKATVTFRPKVGETRLDLGLMERTISVTSGSAPPQKLLVKAMVRGAVRLDNDRTEIELRTFSGGAGTAELIDLTTENPKAELVVVKDECEPKEKDGFTYELLKQSDRGGLGHYRLKIAVAPGRKYGQIKGLVVLEVKGATAQRIRLPFKGQSTLQ